MDLASIPRVDSIILIGLDFSMRPENVRYEVSNGFIKPFPESKVMHDIKRFAILVYNQEKFTPLYHANVCETSNPLAHFLCAMHRQTAPQAHKKEDRQTSISSDTSADSSCSCTSNIIGKNCTLSKLRADSMLPLGHWDSLYYALLSEIRQIHADLHDKFGFAMENGVDPLHCSGLDGSKKEPFRPVELAAVLETVWYNLMDSRLVATLDEAVRMRKIRDNAGKKHRSTSTRGSSDNVDSNDDHGDKGAYEKPPIVEGLVDVNGMTTDDISEMLWSKHAPEVDQACSEYFGDASLLTAYQAKVRAHVTEQTRALDADPSSSSTCRCRGKCVCNIQCDTHSDYCTCASHTELLPHTCDTEASDVLPSPGLAGQDMTQKSRPMHGIATALDRMEINPQLAPAVEASPSNLQHDHNMEKTEAQKERKLPTRYKTRTRTNTNSSDLAYVPERKTTRGKGKDMYPLGFYHEGSPGRYPRIRRDSSVGIFDVNSAGAAERSARVPPRKPVPTPLMPTQPYVAPDAGYGVVTPPSDNKYSPKAFAVAKAHAAYHENTKIYNWMQQTQAGVTESFPVTSANPRGAVISDPFVDQTSPSDPAYDYVGLLGRHPSSFEQAEEATEPHPKLTRSLTTTPPRVIKSSKASASTINLPTLKSMTGNTSKPVPALPPMPECIQPRPAKVQRYVSAGGDLPLSLREEIKGPAFHTTGFNTPINHTSGAGMGNADVDAALSDPDWVRTKFGEDALERLSKSPPSKGRDSNGSVAMTDHQRNSCENGARASMDKTNPRDRTSSGVSRFKRVFSRKNSANEFDSAPASRR